MQSWCRISAVAVAGLLVLDGMALAARYNKSEVQVQAKQTKLTEAPKKKEKKERRRPQLEAEEYRRASNVRGRVAKLTDAAIRKLRQLMAVTEDNDPEKPDFIFRLAEHFREKKWHFEFRAREMDEPIFGENDPNRKARLKSEQKGFEQASRKWMIEAVKMYLAIYGEPKYAKYKRMDEVLFNLAAMLNEVERRDKAREVFGRLIRNYPQSKYIPDALLSFAEYYFNQGEVEKALSLYERVGRYPDSPIYGYSVYKQGWCWLNLKNQRRALELFVKVIKNADRWAGTKRGKIILVKEAKKDAVRAYSHVGTPADAWRFFKRIGGNYAMTMLERLADTYYDQGKFDPSVQIFKELIRLNPKSKSLCSWQYNIVKSTLSGKDKRQQVVEVKRLASVYSLLKTRPDMRKTALAECENNASGLLRELATTWHREAQKTQNADTYALAQYLYREYLDHFPKARDAYVMSFYYAELLFKLEKWQQAADAYTHVVKMQPGKYLKEAAYAAVISWKNALNVEQEIKDTGKLEANNLQERPISPNQQKMIAAFDTYIKYVPNSPELVAIKYRKARIYYEHNHFKRAVDLFADIATKHSDHELALYSANLLLDSLNAMKDFVSLEKWLDRLLANPKLAQGEQKTEWLKLKGQIEAKRADQLHKQKRYRECGEAYAAIANKYPNDKKWAKIVYNAAMCFESARLIGLAIQLRSKLVKHSPDDPLAQRALYMIGANYHALAWYSRAATHYEQFAKKFPGEKEAPKAMQNAIVFRLGRAEYDKAIEDAQFFAKTYGSRKKYVAASAGVVFSLGTIYEQKNDVDAVLKHYKSYLSKWGKKGGVDRQIRANVKLGEVLWAASCPRGAGVNGACIKVSRVRSKRTIRRHGRGKARKTIELRTQCGPQTKSKITVVKRDRTRARNAQGHFKTALSLYKRSGKKAMRGSDKAELTSRKTALLYAVAQARFLESEAAFEDFLETKFPEGLDFSPKNKKKLAASNKKFKKYLDTKGKKLAKTRAMYQDVIKLRSAHWAIAGAARIGQLFQNFADALYTAPVPKPPVPKVLRRRAQREEFIQLFTDAYCDKLEDEAGKLEAKAKQGLAACLDTSTEFSWYNEWSRLCEKELNQINPAEYPLASEIRAAPGYLSVRPTRAGLITELK
ncbi:MAG: tetratricopeptide repeat protein [Deltaproteobacteria bacterium]|nr:tetratricopeptide repeat protein [Deltaproteobacteria bacterium]